MSAPSPTPAGWYPDPATGAPRWWDGYGWAAPSTSAGPATVPAGTPVYTVWIWLNTLLPILSSLAATWQLIAFSDVLMAQLRQTLALGSDPSALSGYSSGLIAQMFSMSAGTTVITLLSWVVYGLCVLFAAFDHRDLGRLGYTRRFHWAWSFLAPVYPIGRSVIVARQAGRGRAPMWVTIAYLALSTAAGFVLAFWLLGQMFSAIPGLR